MDGFELRGRTSRQIRNEFNDRLQLLVRIARIDGECSRNAKRSVRTTSYRMLQRLGSLSSIKRVMQILEKGGLYPKSEGEEQL